MTKIATHEKVVWKHLLIYYAYYEHWGGVHTLCGKGKKKIKSSLTTHSNLFDTSKRRGWTANHSMNDGLGARCHQITFNDKHAFHNCCDADWNYKLAQILFFAVLQILKSDRKKFTIIISSLHNYPCCPVALNIDLFIAEEGFWCYIKIVYIVIYRIVKFGWEENTISVFRDQRFTKQSSSKIRQVNQLRQR